MNIYKLTKLFLITLFFTCKAFGGIAVPDPNYLLVVNPFIDKTHTTDLNIASPQNFTYSTNNNFTQLNWSYSFSSNTFIAIWRSKYFKPPQVINNNWYGYSCVVVLPSNINSFIDKENIISTNVIVRPRIETVKNGVNYLYSVISPSLDYPWLLYFSTNLTTWYFDDWWYGYGNSFQNLKIKSSSLFAEVYNEQYVSDYHYFIFAFQSFLPVAPVDSSRFPSQGLSLNFFPSFRMSKVIWLKP